jgi:type IV pilus assembly protein PilX
MKTAKPSVSGRVHPHRAMRGASLIFALLAIVAFSLIAAALVRSVDSGSIVAGNLSFKQDVSALANRAIEDAATQIATARYSTGDNAAVGYYSSSHDNLDAANLMPEVTNRSVVDWVGDSCGTASYPAGTWAACLTPRSLPAVNGNTAQYVITRLCRSTTSAHTPEECLGPVGVNSGTSPQRGSFDYQNPDRLKTQGTSPNYRIVVRTVGPRNTTSYTEAIAYY